MNENRSIKFCLADRRIHVYLPFGYFQDLASKYPVILLQDGDFLFKESLDKLDELIRNGSVRPFILVGIESVARNTDYTPWAHPPVHKDWSFEGKGESYLDFLEEELLPYLRSQYRVMEDAAETAIGGASLGALISLYAIYTRSHLFQKGILLSPSLWYSGFLSFMRKQIEYNTTGTYMYVGSLEGRGKTNLQQFMVYNCKEGFDILTKQSKHAKQTIKFERSAFGVHEDAFFIEYFIKALEFLYSSKKE